MPLRHEETICNRINLLNQKTYSGSTRAVEALPFCLIQKRSKTVKNQLSYEPIPDSYRDTNTDPQQVRANALINFVTVLLFHESFIEVNEPWQVYANYLLVFLIRK